MTALIVTLGMGLCLALAESGLGLGLVLPGETAVVILAATLGSTSELMLLGLAVALGATAGDHIGFWLGRRYGDSLRETRAVRRLGRHHYDRATRLLRRRGGSAVFLTRLMPVLRTLTPAAAGASGLEYRRFAKASVSGSALWASVYVGGGSAVSRVVGLMNDWFGRASGWVLAVVLLAGLAVLVVRSVARVRPKNAALVG